MFPEVQKKAQEEIDAVIGRDCLPNEMHRALLPYVEALMTEVLRWMPPAPLGRCTGESYFSLICLHRK